MLKTRNIQNINIIGKNLFSNLFVNEKNLCLIKLKQPYEGLNIGDKLFGGPYRIRTDHLLSANEAL